MAPSATMSLAESNPDHPHGVTKQPNTESIHERSLDSREGENDLETGSEPESEADLAEIERIYR